MDCFLGRVASIAFKRLPRIVDGKALPMNYALLGNTGIIVARECSARLARKGFAARLARAVVARRQAGVLGQDAAFDRRDGFQRHGC